MAEMTGDLVAGRYRLADLVGQGGIPLLSDPLGRGWNLFGTRQYRISTALTASGTSTSASSGAPTAKVTAITVVIGVDTLYNVVYVVFFP